MKKIVNEKINSIILMVVFMAIGIIVLIDSNYDHILISTGVAFLIGALLILLHTLEIIDLTKFK